MSDKTILYVEDNEMNRLLVRRILQAEGYEVLEAENASNAMKIVQDLTPSLILMDINMPEVDGYTLTGKMRELTHLAEVPIIALTANVMKGDRERTLEAGCNGYIQKPIDVDALPDVLASYM
jgi:two-component system cell cycle response regulator DivK